VKPILFFLFFLPHALYAQAPLAIRNATVVDVEAKKLRPSQTVVVQNGIITAVGKKSKLPPGAQVIDGTGKYVVPGWVDAHVHFSQSGGLYTRPDAIDLRAYKPHSQEIDWTHRNMEDLLRRYLKAGITTVVDVGATVNFLKQRDTFQNRSYAPAVYMTGPLLTTWEPPIYKNLEGDEPFREMKTPEDARRYVQQQLPYRPDFIKIWYILLGQNKDSAARASLPLVQAAIDEAHKAGLRVAVHATERITAQLSVEAGADFLVHDVEDEPVTDAFVALLKKKKTVMSPTLVVAGNYDKVFGQTYRISEADLHYAHPTPLNSVLDLATHPDTALTRTYRAYINQYGTRTKRDDSVRQVNVKKLLDGSVTLAVGTDAGNIGTQHVSSYWDELKAMQQSGLNLWQLLQAATVNGAKAVGKEAEFGAVKKGQRADLLLLNKNPLDSLANWQDINLVINKGVALQPDSIVQSTPETLVAQQLAAYNAHNLEAFLEPYADDVAIYDFPAQLLWSGKEEMRKNYQFLRKMPDLHCRLLNRMVQGNTVVDHEEVRGFGDKPIYGVVVYQIKNGKIASVHFSQ
jgi:imidazolonepropionase-like amidohydrolase